MNLRNLLLDNVKSLNYFDYYKKIGYTDAQSLVLSLFPYGNKYNQDGFFFYMNLYKNLEKKDKTLCEYISDKVVEIYKEKSGLNPYTLLKDGKEYKEASKKKTEEYGTWSVMASLNSLGFNAKPIRKSSGICGQSLSAGNVAALNFSPMRSLCLAEDVEGAEGIGDLDGLEFSDSEEVGTDSYNLIEEKGTVDTLTNPTSTFRMTSNTAAFGILRKNKMRAIKNSMVRIEEILNNFEYNLSKPTKRMFNINTELCDKPNSKNKLLFVGVQGKDVIPNRQNITLLLDASGSMYSHNRETQTSILTILSKMNDGDVLSLVTYSSTDHTMFENYKIDGAKSKDYVIEKLYEIEIMGCTYGSKGIETAYDLTKRTFIEDGINRVILMTDGDLNFGITSKDGLKELILKKKDDGIFLSVLGVGLYNYKDDTLEVLSKNGNGNYCTIDCLTDIKENILDKYNSLVFTIAKDVKAQVEFNPKFVKEYRLIGYENRVLNHNDFKNDKVISEPFGCGSYGIALYDLVMQDGEIESDLKFQKPVLTNSEDICSVSVRYKEPLEDESKELSVNVKNKEGKLSDNLLLAYTIYVVCETLRKSDFVTDKDKKAVKDLIPEKDLKDLYEKNREHFDFLISLVM